jgi:hypothetical protein
MFKLYVTDGKLDRTLKDVQEIDKQLIGHAFDNFHSIYKNKRSSVPDLNQESVEYLTKVFKGEVQSSAVPDHVHNAVDTWIQRSSLNTQIADEFLKVNKAMFSGERWVVRANDDGMFRVGAFKGSSKTGHTELNTGESIKLSEIEWTVPMKTYYNVNEIPTDIRNIIWGRLSMASVMRSRLPNAADKFINNDKLFPIIKAPDGRSYYYNEIEILEPFEMLTLNTDRQNSTMTIMSKE